MKAPQEIQESKQNKTSLTLSLLLNNKLGNMSNFISSADTLISGNFMDYFRKSIFQCEIQSEEKFYTF